MAINVEYLNISGADQDVLGTTVAAGDTGTFDITDSVESNTYSSRLGYLVGIGAFIPYNGVAGPTGPTGATGPTGPAGATGPTGPTGP